MASCHRSDTLFIFFCFLLFGTGLALEITELRGPHMIQNGSETSVVLDCDYQLSESESGLVVKWFFNNEPAPVYQWIPSQKPQDLGVLKGKLDLEWKASEHEAKKHRALHIVRPTTELSGEYTCLVSTFDEEKTKSKRLVVFVPEKSITLTQSKSDDEDSVIIKCEAEGVFPEPTLRLFAGTEEDTKSEVEGVTRKVKERDGGVFDITASKRLTDRDLESPTIFDCELGIKETEYKRKKSLVYYPDGYTGTPLGVTEAEVVAVTGPTAEHGSGSGSITGVTSWLYLSVLVVLLLQRYRQ